MGGPREHPPSASWKKKIVPSLLMRAYVRIAHQLCHVCTCVGTTYVRTYMRAYVRASYVRTQRSGMQCCQC